MSPEKPQCLICLKRVQRNLATVAAKMRSVIDLHTNWKTSGFASDVFYIAKNFRTLPAVDDNPRSAKLRSD